VDGAQYPRGTPGRIHLAATLPHGARLEAPGTIAFNPVALAMQPTLTGFDLAVVRSYWPEDARFTIDGGRVDAALTAAYATSGGLRVDGDLTTSRLAVGRPGQPMPLVSASRLSAAVNELRMRDGAVTVKRVSLEAASALVDTKVPSGRQVTVQATNRLAASIDGTAWSEGRARVDTIAVTASSVAVDAAGPTPHRLQLTSLGVLVQNATWPSSGPAAVRVSAETRQDEVLTVAGIVDPDTLHAEVDVAAINIDAARWTAAAAPADAPAHVASGRLAVNAHAMYDRADGLRVFGEAAIDDLAVNSRPASAPLLHAPRVTIRASQVTVHDGDVVADRVRLSGTATVAVAPGRSLDLQAFRFETDRIAWPSAASSPVRVAATLEAGGRLTADGEIDLASRSAPPR
jgi:hypothetical protein